MNRELVPRKEIILNNNAEIKVGNELVNGRWSLPYLEANMLVALISHVNKNADEFVYNEISAKNLGEYMGLGQKNMYQQLDMIAEKLHRRQVKLLSHTPGKDGRRDYVLAHWVDYLRYNSNTSSIIYRFSPEMAPLLLKVKEAYVKAAAKPMIAFRRSHSHHLFLLFLEWYDIGNNIKTISITELKELLDLGSMYDAPKDFVKYVVQRSVDEINTLTDLCVKAEPIRAGRSYSHINFVIKKKPNAVVVHAVDEIKKRLPEDRNELRVTLYEELIKLNVNKKFALKYVAENEPDDIRVNLDYAYKSIQKKKLIGQAIENIPAYVAKALKDNYGVVAAKQADIDNQARRAKMTAAQRQAEDDLKAGMAVIQEELAARKSDDNNLKLEQLKQEFWARSTAEQEQYVDYIKEQIANEKNMFKRNKFGKLLDLSFSDIILDNENLTSLMLYSISLRSIKIETEQL